MSFLTPNEVLKKCTKIAVIGLKNDPNKYVYKIYKRLIEEKYEVYGVSDYIDELEGNKIYRSLYDLPTLPELCVFVVAPQNGLVHIEACEQLKINHVWMQPGTYNDEVIQVLEDKKLNYYLNCVLRRLDEN